MKWMFLFVVFLVSLPTHSATQKYIRYMFNGEQNYGSLEGNIIKPIQGDIFGDFSVIDDELNIDDVEVLLPTVPEKVFAVGMNFASHLSSPSNQPPPLFLKLPSSLLLSGKDLTLPLDARNVHFEGELVLVIGKVAKNISEAEAKEVIFGVTVGNDITERSWQGQDLQWMRAKAADNFGPIAATITRGVDYENVLLTTRLNNKIVQQENTRNMIHSTSKVVSYLSKYFTLKPGDLIFMGTPGRTQALSDGDVVSVTIDGVDTVENVIRY
ncbi:fumarylacetoacetate hydrolase family protein [Vibrio hannami]|uniref:fumarylacetoacetate hydrolase family protein n=1 Tax=Vibrio hannami TaxID=2717094 RepID=UPI00240F7297|nr:fumarylacetoacetate hydrolase family protein [Vibrio hannami]MDG3086538.1 fumarylacetoacetate hydrolase family protein [Vibrio hannami]